MFNTFFDSSNSDGHLEKEDVDDILEKFRKYCGFVRSDERFLRMNDIMQAFYSCMVDQVVREKVSDAMAVGFSTVRIKYKINNRVTFKIKAQNLARVPLNHFLIHI